MAELATRFPDGMSWKSPYDPTVFVRDSIRAVVDTLLEAVIPVVLVVILFLQTARLDHSAAGGPDLRGRHLCRAVYAGLRSIPSACSGWCWRSASWWMTPS